ncbi:aminotransferase class I/II-fold pyridoxal phosphate-dependent enzyme [Psychrobacillus sp. NEAU-3TGS]|uniref:threonine aldolase family protein n=1 Tax=Psychrobacillus sp. NEAU-3TGS TaxID=2995412 RepID=UPI0024997716|nr:aminotransferase class I/II-fold pyridoxal phosphate-dependent enzyme [Psychrobacillus sp. NEAU-3TGS]MDI2586844.1 aminotransferase class I/II-fold pyridoxal phosphate-dependent enzyme [Psychrobacillus sp. NEAU-3TGS]
MSEAKLLFEAFKETKYQVSGHGKRNIQVLKSALQNLDSKQESDIYGNGRIIEEFQKKMAEYLGKEKAVFFPSGTMAQQIALRIWCDDKGLKKVAYHPLCHLEIHEEDGLKELHHIQSILLANKDRLIELEDIANMDEEVACILLELPQREIGGQLPDYATIEKISTYCRDQGIRLHLDGARLFEILPYYEKTAAEVCSLFDSVYVSFYKGIGGVAGAILAGDKAFTDKSKIWKRRHGGDLISLYPYIVSANYYFDENEQRMNQFYHDAIELALFFNSCESVSTIPPVPVSNMFHVHFQASLEKVEPILAELYKETSIGLTGYLKEMTQKSCGFEVNVGNQYAILPKEKLKRVFQLLDEKLRKS